MSDRSTRRRDFLAAAGAAPLVLAQSAKGANDRITFALIGAGGRGRGGAKCLAVADVYKPNLEKGLAVAGADAKGYLDYQDILARDDIDAVLIATPDHHHGPMMLAAVHAGKDVYCEKPMTHSIGEGRRRPTEGRRRRVLRFLGLDARGGPPGY